MGSWRVGREVGRTIYDGDTLIGIMDTTELAAVVVEAVNRRAAPLAAPGAFYAKRPKLAGTPRGDE